MRAPKRDPRQPRPEAIRRLEPTQRAIRAQKRLLHDILRGVSVQHVRVCDRVHLPRVSQHERLERPIADAPASLDEFSVRWLRHSRAPVAISIDGFCGRIQKTKARICGPLAPETAWSVRSDLRIRAIGSADAEEERDPWLP